MYTCNSSCGNIRKLPICSVWQLRWLLQVWRSRTSITSISTYTNAALRKSICRAVNLNIFGFLDKSEHAHLNNNSPHMHAYWRSGAHTPEYLRRFHTRDWALLQVELTDGTTYSRRVSDVERLGARCRPSMRALEPSESMCLKPN